MQSVLIVIHLIVVSALVVVVLLQRSEGGAIGIGGGGFMTGRAQANVLTRATSILAALFFATSLGLTVLANINRPKSTIFDAVKDLPAKEAPAAPAETSPGNLLDQLKRMEEQGTAPSAAAPTVPAPGSEPAVPPPPAPVESSPAAPPSAPAKPATEPAPAAKKLN
jgi:preprotein translocase subunit SecG